MEAINDLAKEDGREFVKALKIAAAKENERQKEMAGFMTRLADEFQDHVNKLKAESEKIVKERSVHRDILSEQDEKYKEILEMNAALMDQNARLKRQQIEEKNRTRKTQREAFIRRNVFWWKVRGGVGFYVGVLVILGVIIHFCWLNEWNPYLSEGLIDKYKNNLIVSGFITLADLIIGSFFLKIFSDRFNQSSINAYKSTLTIPDDLKDLPVDP